MEARSYAYTHVHKAYTPKREGTCTCKHVDTRTHTCIKRTQRKGPSTGTWKYVQMRSHTCLGCTQREWPVQARGSTSKSVHTRAQCIHTEKGQYRHMEARPYAYIHVHKAYTPKRAGTCTCKHVQTLTHTYIKRTQRKGPSTGTWKHVQTRSHTCTRCTQREGPVRLHKRN